MSQIDGAGYLQMTFTFTDWRQDSDVMEAVSSQGTGRVSPGDN